MIHLKFPQKRGFFTWEELGCLGRALGFQVDMFEKSLPEEFKLNEGLPIKTLLQLIDVHRYFHNATDQTFNIHTSEWNLSAIKKGLRLLDYNFLSFEDLQAVRVAYQTYETGDTKGMMIDEHTLQRALKMCGRMISPLKMMHRIKHMRENFEEPDRIQLHEFLDLLLWCDMFEHMQLGLPQLNTDKDERMLFKIDKFSEFLSHHDERLASRLDQEYRNQEWHFTKERHGSKKMSREPPVNPEMRKRVVRYHKDKYKYLQGEVADSETRVQCTKAGYVRPRPLSAPDLVLYEPFEPSMAASTLAPRPHTVSALAGHLFTPQAREPAKRGYVSRPPLHEYHRPKTAPAVTEQDVVETSNSMESLKFEMETIEMKYQQMLNEDMDFLMPGYREKIENRPSPEPTPRSTPRPPKESRPNAESINALAYPVKRGPPPTHAKDCDARFRGWHRVKTKRGPHFVLVSPSYDNTPTGRMLMKMHQHTQAQVENLRDDYLFRYTRRDQVMPDKPCARPNTAPSGQIDRNIIDVTPLSSARSDISAKTDDSNPRASKGGSEKMSQSEVSSGVAEMPFHTGSLASDQSSVISWGDLKIYAEEYKKGDPMKLLEEETTDKKRKMSISRPDSRMKVDRRHSHASNTSLEDQPLVDSPRSRAIELGKVGKITVLEGIKEAQDESSRAPTSQGVHNYPHPLPSPQGKYPPPAGISEAEFSTVTDLSNSRPAPSEHSLKPGYAHDAASTPQTDVAGPTVRRNSKLYKRLMTRAEGSLSKALQKKLRLGQT